MENEEVKHLDYQGLLLYDQNIKEWATTKDEEIKINQINGKSNSKTILVTPGSTTPATYYTASEAEAYNIEHGLQEGDPDYKHEGDLKTPASTTNTNIEVNIDNSTIVQDGTSGQLKVSSTALTKYIGDKDGENKYAINVSPTADSNNNKTISLDINSESNAIEKTTSGVKVKLGINKFNNPSIFGDNVREAYALSANDVIITGSNNEQVIKIYKDSSLLDIKLLHAIPATYYTAEEATEYNTEHGLSPSDPDYKSEGDLKTPAVKPVYTKLNGWIDIEASLRTEENLALCFAYENINGEIVVEAIQVGSFLRETEFKEGLQVVDGEVSVKLSSEKVRIAATPEGVTPGSEQDTGLVEVATLNLSNGVQINHIQDAINYAINTFVPDTYTKAELDESEEVIARALNDLNTRVESSAQGIEEEIADINQNISDFEQDLNNTKQDLEDNYLKNTTIISGVDNNGHDYVDLGLPSGLLWATTNIGAANPENDGLYFAWGETEGYTDATARNTATGGTGGFDQTSYDAGSAASISADLTLSNDAVRANMGGSWRMPTKAEFDELINSNYTDKELTTINGVSGYKFMKKSDHSVYVFFPASGYWNGTSQDNNYGVYWSSTFYDIFHAYSLFFLSESGDVSTSHSYRYLGFSVRGVISNSQIEVPVTGVTQAEKTSWNNKADASVFGASGENHSTGLVPDPGDVAGTTKFLREDGTWQEVVTDNSDVEKVISAALNDLDCRILFNEASNNTKFNNIDNKYDIVEDNIEGINQEIQNDTKVISQALNDLDIRILDSKSKIEKLQENEILINQNISEIKQNIEDDELVTSAAINEVSQTVNDYVTDTKLIVETLNRRTPKSFTNTNNSFLNLLKQAVADQNLEKYGLKVGDYTIINGHTYVIAGLNPMKGTTTPYRLTQNHVGLIVIPHTTQAWNASGNTSTGADNRGAGYKNSDLHYYLTNTLLPLVETDLGASNLLGHSKLLTNAVNTTAVNRRANDSDKGASSGWEWVADCKICALSEVQVYGATVWSSSGYDTGEACRQLDVFRVYNHTEIFGSEYPWLRDVASASHACFARFGGVAYSYTASRAYCVAGLILFN